MTLRTKIERPVVIFLIRRLYKQIHSWKREPNICGSKNIKLDMLRNCYSLEENDFTGITELEDRRDRGRTRSITPPNRGIHTQHCRN